MSSGTIGASFSGVGPWHTTLTYAAFDRVGISLNWYSADAAAPLVSIKRYAEDLVTVTDQFDLSAANGSDNYAVFMYEGMFKVEAIFYDGSSVLSTATVYRTPFLQREWGMNNPSLLTTPGDTALQIGRAITIMYQYSVDLPWQRALTWFDQVPFMFTQNNNHVIIWNKTRDAQNILADQAAVLDRYFPASNVYVGPA